MTLGNRGLDGDNRRNEDLRNELLDWAVLLCGALMLTSAVVLTMLGGAETVANDVTVVGHSVHAEA